MDTPVSNATSRVTRPTWLLLAGLALGAVVYEIGVYYVRGLDRDENASWKACIAEAASAGNSVVVAPNLITGDKDIDATTLEMHRGNAVMNAQSLCNSGDRLIRQGIIRTDRQFRFWAAVAAILGALPWAWYFLLRRIVELRAAMRGVKP